MPVDVQPKRPTAKGPAAWFTGDVWIDSIARGEEPSRVRVSAVHFTPSARTAWHSHAVGQTLYVTEGRGSEGDGSAELGHQVGAGQDGGVAGAVAGGEAGGQAGDLRGPGGVLEIGHALAA